MSAVRYVALAALVVWIGGMLELLGYPLLRAYEPIAYGCGVIILAALFVLKFIGPPPRAFRVRAALVAAMLVITVLGQMRRVPMAIHAINLLIGFVLLIWYTHE